MKLLNNTQKLKHYPDVLTSDQVAEILNVSKKTVYDSIKKEKLHAIKVGREYRIAKVKLVEMLVM